MLCENNSDFESFSCGNEILVSDFYGDYKMFEGRKAKAWGEDEGGANSKAKEKKRKKRGRPQRRFFFIFYIF